MFFLLSYAGRFQSSIRSLASFRSIQQEKGMHFGIPFLMILYGLPYTFGVKPYSSNTARASFVCRNSRNAAAPSGFAALVS